MATKPKSSPPANGRGPPPPSSSSSSSAPSSPPPRSGGQETKRSGQPPSSSPSPSSLASSTLSPAYDRFKPNPDKYVIPWDEKIVAIASDRHQRRLTLSRTLIAWCAKKSKTYDDVFDPSDTGFGVSNMLLHPTRIVVFYSDGLISLNQRLLSVGLQASPLLPEVRSGVIGPIRKAGLDHCLGILRDACPSLVLTRRFDLIHTSATSTDAPTKLMKDSFDFVISRSEFPTMTATVAVAPFATNIRINLRETHKGKKIYCSRCLGTDHFHTNKRPCQRPIVCSNCLSPNHKSVSCPENKACRECKQSEHHVLSCPLVKRKLVHVDIHRPSMSRPPPIDTPSQYPPLPSLSSPSSSSPSPPSSSSSSGRMARSKWQVPSRRRAAMSPSSPAPPPPLPPLLDRESTALTSWVQQQIRAIDAIHDQLATVRQSYTQFLDLISASVTRSTTPSHRPHSQSASSTPLDPNAVPSLSSSPSLALLASPVVSPPSSPSTSSPPSTSPTSSPSSMHKRPSPALIASSVVSDDDMQIAEDGDPPPETPVLAVTKKARTQTPTEDGKEGKGEKQFDPPVSSDVAPAPKKPERPRPKQPAPSPQQPLINAILSKGLVRAPESLTPNGDSSTKPVPVTTKK